MKRCIIIGAGSGLSQAIAVRFGQSGHSIGLVSRSSAKLQALSDKLNRLGISTYWEAADAGDPVALDDALDALVMRQGAFDVLIYNAAVLQPGSPLDVTTETLASDIRVNLLGAHQAARKLAPAMIERGSGAILFTGGGLALEPFPEWTSLAVGKSALRGLAISLYKDLAPKGVHVSVVAVCGLVAPGGPFDPNTIAEEFWRVATQPSGVADREVIFQPPGTDPFYNDPERRHVDTSVLPVHVRKRSDGET